MKDNNKVKSIEIKDEMVVGFDWEIPKKCFEKEYLYGYKLSNKKWKEIKDGFDVIDNKLFDEWCKSFDRKLKEYGEEILKSDCDLNDDRDDDLSEDDNEWIENILIKIEKEG